MRLIKRKGKWGRLLALAAVCSTVLGDGFNVSANSTSNTIIYEKEESEAYTLSLEVKGAGTVSDGEDFIRNGEKRYLVTVDGSITFELLPDKNAAIEKVILNEEDVTSQISKNKITVKGQAKGQVMKVSFAVKQDQEDPQEKPPQDPENPPEKPPQDPEKPPEKPPQDPEKPPQKPQQNPEKPQQKPQQPQQKPQQAPGGSPQAPQGSGRGPKTGDQSRAGMYALLAAAAAVTVWGLTDKRKKDKGHSDEGGQQGE